MSGAPPFDNRSRAKTLVEFWRQRGWMSASSPLHVHPIDLTKLEELIAQELDETTRSEASGS